VAQKPLQPPLFRLTPLAADAAGTDVVEQLELETALEIEVVK